MLCFRPCRDAWHALQASRDPAVLCEVVSCLPLLVVALGPVLTHREVFPALTSLLHSHLNWISGHLVQVMVDLLEQMPRSGHEVLLKVGTHLLLTCMTSRSAEAPMHLTYSGMTCCRALQRPQLLPPVCRVHVLHGCMR